MSEVVLKSLSYHGLKNQLIHWEAVSKAMRFEKSSAFILSDQDSSQTMLFHLIWAFFNVQRRKDSCAVEILHPSWIWLSALGDFLQKRQPHLQQTRSKNSILFQKTSDKLPAIQWSIFDSFLCRFSEIPFQNYASVVFESDLKSFFWKKVSYCLVSEENKKDVFNDFLHHELTKHNQSRFSKEMEPLLVICQEKNVSFLKAKQTPASFFKVLTWQEVQSILPNHYSSVWVFDAPEKAEQLFRSCVWLSSQSIKVFVCENASSFLISLPFEPHFDSLKKPFPPKKRFLSPRSLLSGLKKIPWMF
jgi:hypothetical protein